MAPSSGSGGSAGSGGEFRVFRAHHLALFLSPEHTRFLTPISPGAADAGVWILEKHLSCFAHAPQSFPALPFTPSRSCTYCFHPRWPSPPEQRTRGCGWCEFRGGFVVKAYRLVYHSTLGSTLIKKKRRFQMTTRPFSFTLSRFHPHFLWSSGRGGTDGADSG